MAKNPRSLTSCFTTHLRISISLRKKSLPPCQSSRRQRKAKSSGAAFEKHEAETEGQIERLEQVFAAIDKKPQGASAHLSCRISPGLIRERSP
jgi:ferritin-like metal-binding protein YciE